MSRLPTLIYSRRSRSYVWFLPASTYTSTLPTSTPPGQTQSTATTQPASFTSYDRFNHSNRTAARPTRYTTHRSRAVGSYLSLEPVPTFLYATYRVNWKSTSAASYWSTASPCSPISKHTEIHFVHSINIFIQHHLEYLKNKNQFVQ